MLPPMSFLSNGTITFRPLLIIQTMVVVSGMTVRKVQKVREEKHGFEKQ